MKCYYHSSDLDGKCGGAIVYQHFKEQFLGGDFPSLEMIGIDYADIFDISTIKADEKIFIVDFSFKPVVMNEILKMTQDVTWIDHHKSAMEYVYSRELPGIRDNNFSGCELAWKYLHSSEEMPRIVEMLGRYDVWDFSKYEEKLDQLQIGIRMFDNAPTSPNWERWLGVKIYEYTPRTTPGIIFSERGFTDDGLQEMLDQGKVALEYRKKTWASLIKAQGFSATFEGHTAICCNASGVNSKLFDTVEGDYDLMIPFVFDGSRWTVSLYTKKPEVDCSEIAKKYGGGGHRRAAGFQCRELPFKKET